MDTITKTNLVADIDVAGTRLHWVPVTRWMLHTYEGIAYLDIVASTGIVKAGGDRRDLVTLLGHLAHIGLDLDVNEDDQSLEWMIGFDSHVWAVPATVIIDHCKATLASYQEG